MRIAIVGATGLVGQIMLKVLGERCFPLTDLYPVASDASVGKTIDFRGKKYVVQSLAETLSLAPDIALFSAGASVSAEWAPAFAGIGTFVIDNSSAWRMTEGVPLVVPEVNGEALGAQHKIIANPNCSTIQLVVALYPIHRAFGIRRIIISTYQSVTGTGMKAIRQFEAEVRGDQDVERVYPHPIYANLLPHCDVFLDNDYTKEEMKLVHETRKIMGIPDLPVTATAVRVPVLGGHSEAVNMELASDASKEELWDTLAHAPGVWLMDNPAAHVYPMPVVADGQDMVCVGRLRRDESRDRCWNLFIVADNLRKGAATNAVQIAELLLKKGLISKTGSAVMA